MIHFRQSKLALRQSMLVEQGSKCNIPNLPVNSSVMMSFVKEVGPIECKKNARDWAYCNVS